MSESCVSAMPPRTIDGDDDVRRASTVVDVRANRVIFARTHTTHDFFFVVNRTVHIDQSIDHVCVLDDDIDDDDARRRR